MDEGQGKAHRPDALRERVARVLAENAYEAPGPLVLDRDRELAGLVLAALGLNDLDAAAIRSIDVWAHEYANDDWRDLSAEGQLSVARRVLEAAFNPPER